MKKTPIANPTPHGRRATTPNWQATRVVRTLWPGAPGTGALLEHHGSKLVCVRYRQDASGVIRHRTVELIVETRPVRMRIEDSQTYGVQVWWGEDELARDVKAAGARWDRAAKLWMLNGAAVKALRLQRRIRLRCP